MAYFLDLSPYTYFFPRARTLNVGWLARGHDFPKGGVPHGFLERLAAYPQGPITENGMRGITCGVHQCEFCPSFDGSKFDDDRKSNKERIAILKQDVKRGVAGAKEALRKEQQLATEFARAATPGINDAQPYCDTGDIWVPAGEWTFAAPSMISHYINVHGYFPPQVFIDATMGRPLSQPVTVQH